MPYEKLPVTGSQLPPLKSVTRMASPEVDMFEGQGAGGKEQEERENPFHRLIIFLPFLIIIPLCFVAGRPLRSKLCLSSVACCLLSAIPVTSVTMTVLVREALRFFTYEPEAVPT